MVDDPSSNETNPRGQKRKHDGDEEHTAKRQSYSFRCSWDNSQSTAGQGLEGRKFHPDDLTEGCRYNEDEQNYMRYMPTDTVTDPDSDSDSDPNGPFLRDLPISMRPMQHMQPMRPMQNTGFTTLNNTQPNPHLYFPSLDYAANFHQDWSAPGCQYANQHAAPPNNQPGTSRSHFAPQPPDFTPPILFAQKATKASEADPLTNDTEKFTDVFKFSTLCGRKVVVTLGELRRRMGSPERQGWDMLARLTRHPRTSQIAFRKKMIGHGFALEDETDVQSADSTIAMLLEEDALTLGKDFKRLLSGELLSSILSSIASVNNRGVEIAKEAHGILYMLEQARSYLRKPDSQPVIRDAHASRQFSLFTHGFGPLVAAAVIDSLVQVIEVIKIRPFPDQKDFAPLNPAPMSDNDATTARTPTRNKGGNGASVSAVDSSLLHRQQDDHIPICESLPRIGYDVPLIEMTRGEIRRRVIGPEKVHLSYIHKLMRRRKTKNTIADLRRELAENGITVPVTRQKAHNHCSWTWISEEESTAIAKETGSALVRLPPSQVMVQGARAFPNAAALLKNIAVSLSDAMMRVGESPSHPRVETQADLRILRFALLTHHFGHTFYAYVMNWLQLDVCRN